jgi:hypothetical protein
MQMPNGKEEQGFTVYSSSQTHSNYKMILTALQSTRRNGRESLGALGWVSIYSHSVWMISTSTDR